MAQSRYLFQAFFCLSNVYFAGTFTFQYSCNPVTLVCKDKGFNWLWWTSSDLNWHSGFRQQTSWCSPDRDTLMAECNSQKADFVRMAWLKFLSAQFCEKRQCGDEWWRLLQSLRCLHFASYPHLPRWHCRWLYTIPYMDKMIALQYCVVVDTVFNTNVCVHTIINCHPCQRYLIHMDIMVNDDIFAAAETDWGQPRWVCHWLCDRG